MSPEKRKARDVLQFLLLNRDVTFTHQELSHITGIQADEISAIMDALEEHDVVVYTEGGWTLAPDDRLLALEASLIGQEAIGARDEYESDGELE